jgi:hypothetical protein
MIEVNTSGAVMVDETVELHDQVVMVIIGPCVRDGAAATATKGDVQKRTIKIEEAMVLRGKEGVEYEERIRAEAAGRDETTIKNGMDADAGEDDDLPELEA